MYWFALHFLKNTQLLLLFLMPPLRLLLHKLPSILLP
jgi:hypothetical protein